MASKRIFTSTGATFSPCRTWRYALWRFWGSLLDEDAKTCAFIGLNPSKANETDSDPTVTRCINFADSWGYSRFIMLNAFGICETNAKLAMSHENPVGPETDRYLLHYIKSADLIVAAWGAQKGIDERIQRVVEIATKEAGKQLHCLKTTQAGQPWHPLYVKADTKPKIWRPTECDAPLSK